jgi:hypothetical protein
MSQIYEALRNAQDIRLKNGTAGKDGAGVMGIPDRRASRRWELYLPITVYGHAPGKSPFYQDAVAVSGNANGGLLVLRAPVRMGQDLLLMVDCTSQEQICRIVHLRSRDAKTNEVGVAFLSPCREFWQIPPAIVES